MKKDLETTIESMLELRELEKKIELRRLAIKCSQLESAIFNEEDSDFVDYRIIRNKERAIENNIEKMSRLSDVPFNKIRKLIYYDPCQTWGEYFDQFRAVGVPIATQEEVKEYANSINKK